MFNRSAIPLTVGNGLALFLALFPPGATATDLAFAEGEVQAVSLPTGVVAVGGRQVFVGREVAAALTVCGSSVARIFGSELASGAILAREVSGACTATERLLSDASLSRTTVGSTSNIGISGIVGTGMQGIVGTGVQGIVGTGVQGIVGTGIQGIVGTGVQGIVGTGIQGIVGTGVN